VCVSAANYGLVRERELHLLKTKRTHSREQDEQNVDRGEMESTLMLNVLSQVKVVKKVVVLKLELIVFN